MARIRTLNFLPDYFQTPTNAEFLAATLDQLVNPPSLNKVQGYVGSTFGYGVNAKDHYVTEPTRTRANYQLTPGVVFTTSGTEDAADFITYPGLIDTISLNNGLTDNNSRLFNSQFYSWDSFTDLDKVINYTQYYWLPQGPPAVTVAAATTFNTEVYDVSDTPNGYLITVLPNTAGSINPTITLMRGGSYEFIVNQNSQFWIQGQPGTSGYSPTQPNLPVRDVDGVSNNGATQGVVTFNVPASDDQNQYIFPGNNPVDVVTSIPFNTLNGMPVTGFAGIDGVTSLNGLTVMFYNTGVPDEVGYVQNYFGETDYDINLDSLVTPLALNIGSCTTSAFTLSSGNTTMLSVGASVTFNNPVFGGITGGQVYFVDTILNSTDFTISSSIGGPQVTLTSGTGTMSMTINQGLLSEGFYTNVSQNFYTISYVGDPSSPVIRLLPTASIPNNQNIIPTYGVQWINIPFYRDVNGNIDLVPYITAPLNVLYYQDGVNPENVGTIRIIDANTVDQIDVTTDILGHPNYTSTNGVVFTNGLKIIFDGNVIPNSYLTDQYYVQGVGTAIELVPVSTLVCPEDFTQENYIPFSSTPFDEANWDGELYVPVIPDYITIARNSISKNAWSRSNRWFHADVINATATYNNTPDIITTYASSTNRAVRPIIEFYPNLKLVNAGSIGKNPIDFFDTRATNAMTQVAGTLNYYPDIQTYTGYTGSIASATSTTSTTITIPVNSITGSFVAGMFITDSLNLLPVNTQITEVTSTSTVTTLTVTWENAATFIAGTNASIVASKLDVSNYALFPDARVVFTADTNPLVRSTIYVVNFSQIHPLAKPVITLTPAEDGLVLPDEQTVAYRGYYYQGSTFFYNGVTWQTAQEKTQVNQAPYFDIFDANGVSFSDASVYVGTSFAGCKLFAYGIGTGANDSVLGFPIRYSSIDNIGDISFDVSLNLDTFSYVSSNNPGPVTQKVNTGYVYNYSDITTYARQLGWQTAVALSTQYQNYEFDFKVLTSVNSFVCDIAASPMPTSLMPGWPTIKVYINNVYQPSDAYTYSIGASSTTIVLNVAPTIDTVVQVLLISDQVSQTAYYDIPVNLNNNPLNQDLTTVNIGDIRIQYQDIFINAPNTIGPIFGSNNYRDCGNLIPYGTEIIQNSASLVLPSAFMRNQQNSLIDALLYNSREYINYKQVIVNTVQNTDFVQRYTPSQILDSALQQITSAKTPDQPFFWSDMLPSQSSYITNTYIFNSLSSSTFYPLSQVYNFATANYNGVLVYLFRITDGVVIEKQLITNVDYVISTEAASLEVLITLQVGDQIIIKEYNQTYGSYIPNTPTKLGIYPAFIPAVVLDSDYTVPTYFIKGHDGSYNKLYGAYDSDLNVLVDFRDQALLEFELRVYNNLKLSTQVPISKFDIVPGFFRDSTYSYAEFLVMYSTGFLNWIGQNRLDYKTQYYNTNNAWTYNYTNAANNIDDTPILQGYWRGLYEYFYDTTTPNETPWEMLGLPNEPTWWTARYGPAPYTSDNGILWGDLEIGSIWNNGSPYINPEVARPGLSSIIPVDSYGNLAPPIGSVVGNYNPNTLQKDWIVGDDGPTELSYRRSSTYPYDVTRLFAITKPAEFFNLAVDLDNYQYNTEFNQYLVNDRSHLVLNNIEIYGNGIAKTSYINWIVDYQKQQGIDSTTAISTLLNNLDVRLVYRLAGYSDQNLLQFYVEKGSPNSTNASLLIPNESYSVLLYNNQPFDRILYSGVIVQKNEGYWTVFGNSQLFAYFTIANPVLSRGYDNITVENLSVNVAKNYSATQTTLIPYGTKFYTAQELSQFLASYGAYLTTQGMLFEDMQNGVPVNWAQLIAEFLYWSQTGWETGSIITLNPSASLLQINPQDALVQPLTIQNQNFILNQNLYPIDIKDLAVNRTDNLFSVKAQNQGDSIAYGQFDISNFEHGIVFDNITLFNDTIYNLVTGLRQNRIYLRGSKSAEWNGTVYAGGFILNADNIQEWSGNIKYTKGAIVTYKNNYYQAQTVIQPSNTFNPQFWNLTDYKAIQTGMLSNPSTRAYESSLYYDINQANLFDDADLLGYSLIGYRPRDYLALLDLTNVAQVQLYQNMIINKGTLNSVSAFEGANLPTGGINYTVYENWAILSGQYGGVQNDNFIDFAINASEMTGEPSIVSLTNGYSEVDGSMQQVPLNKIFNYGRPITSPDFLDTTNAVTNNNLMYPSAGYVNFNDVAMSSYFYSGLPNAVDSSNAIVPINDFYVGDYAWLANFMQTWGVFSWSVVGQITQITNNSNSTATVTFNAPHNLTALQPLSIINFANNVDGYYIVTLVPNQNQVVINLNLSTSNNQTSLQGFGIGLTFESHRVSTPSQISSSIDLTTTDFTDNMIWVDTNTDGNWAVYLKSNNYTFVEDLTQLDTIKYGTAVAYSNQFGYIVSDVGNWPSSSNPVLTLGSVYRYMLNVLNGQYQLVQTITNNPSYGASIVHKQNFIVISQTDSIYSNDAGVYIYAVNNSSLAIDQADNMIQVQKIIAPYEHWADSITLSDDTNWLYISDSAHTLINVYQKQNIPLSAGWFTSGQTYVITELGTTDFTAIGAIENSIGTVFVATGIGSGNGVATQITYQLASTIDGTGYGYSSSDGFGNSLTTNYDGSILVVGVPLYNYSVSIEDWGAVGVFNRTQQNFEAYSSQVPATYVLAWTPVGTASITSTTTSAIDNSITCSTSMTGFAINDPVVFTGTFTNGGQNSLLSPNQVYYIQGISGTKLFLKTSRDSNTVLPLGTATGLTISVYVQVTELFVSVNGTVVTDNNYAAISNTLVYFGALNPGDIITVNDSQLFLGQTINSNYHDRTGIHFGYSVETANFGSDILIGSPFEISDINGQEGAVYKYSNGGAKYGLLIGSGGCTLSGAAQLLINGFVVYLSAGNAQSIANQINSANISNVQAAATTDNNLIIQNINTSISRVNQRLVVVAFDDVTLPNLGLQAYTQTQIIQCPYGEGPTQFGHTISVNEFNNIVVSAPAGTRYEGTVFDYVNYQDLENNTVFDNNATQFVDSYPNAGAVYMFEYISEYNESLTNPGNYIYAQSINDTSIDYGYQPLYGTALDFNENVVVVGTANFLPATSGGQVVVYTNITGQSNDWSVYRSSAPVVDTATITNTQLYSASTNNTLVNFDYPDPLNGKLLGAVRENLDFVSGTDPANYNSGFSTSNGNTWGSSQIGKIWFNTTNVRWVNYHQNDDITYNSSHWAMVFPGSDVAVYSWVASFVPPNQYQGPGTLYNVNLFCVSSVINSSNIVVPVYYFWVRNSNIIFTQANKTLSDTVISSYIANPSASGIPYIAPLLPNTIAMYNSSTYFNGTDSIFHIGFGTPTTTTTNTSVTTSRDVPHQEFALIRDGDPEDFLPGFPPIVKQQTIITNAGNITSYAGIPASLYQRYLYSFTGCDGSGAIVPDPFLPPAVQSGIQSRPRQSFFYDRYAALDNYLSYANSILAQYPIVESRPAANFLFASGENYDTTKYWSYINWWAPGYSNNTKSIYQVALYADLAILNVAIGTVVTVLQNGNGKQEVYIYSGNGVWTRIGLQNGTIAIDSSLWDYANAQLGFDGSFFDTSVFDLYPSEETYYIIRALNEQIFTEDLLKYRNSSLILMFQYIQSETVESQNFLPWLNKTSLLDVEHTLRELLPYEVYQTDNFDFLSGYINETKPYHVLVKDFLYEYTGNEVFEGNITDFDLPSQYSSQYQEFISPQLVYTPPNNEFEYLPNSPIWSTAPYTQWYQHHGLSLVGDSNFPITTLNSYVTNGSSTMTVSNANGFPINGVITIDNEQIGYSYVDRALSTLSGLVRGLNGTTIVNHLPGAQIYIDLPPVIVLNGARGYATPPKVTAYIDTSLYPAPTQVAELEAVMSLDSVLSINTITPGEGYSVLPEIRIDPSDVIYFADTAINSALHNIRLYAPTLQTGDVVQYFKGSNGIGAGQLASGQWYYVNVLQDTPTAIIALYATYSDAIKDINRVPVYANGASTDMTLNQGARAFAISTSSPVRENNITIRFDRTTYNSRIIDWVEGQYYGSYFAGNYLDTEQVSSSSITLENTNPDISTILASGQGFVVEISDVTNDRQTIWSSTIRNVSETFSSNNALRLVPNDNNDNPLDPYPNASGTTVGMYVGMPIIFTGSVVGGLIVNQEYYVCQIISEIDFTVAATPTGSAVTLTNGTVGPQGMQCLVAQTIDTAILTVNYPGILTVTQTQTGTNYLTVPTSAIGTGGTTGFYTNLPVFFTEGEIGNVILNLVYYVTTVIDDQTFTMSTTPDPLITTATATAITSNIVTVETTSGFNINDPVIFTNMIISGDPVTTFGNIVAGTTYYVNQIISITEMILSTSINGLVFALSTATGTAQVTDQIDVIQLSTDTGAMTMNVSLPISPGQVNGQQFILYNTSGQFPGVSEGTITNLLDPDVNATITSVNKIALNVNTGGTTNFYQNMPVRVSTTIGGLSTSTTYYVLTYSGMPDPMNPGQFIANIQTTVTNTSSSTNELTCDTTASLYVNMPIVFTGTSLGQIAIGQEYFIHTIVDATHFTISATSLGTELVLTESNGIMLGTGDPYVTISTSINGSIQSVTTDTSGSVMTQYVTGIPTFDFSYILGGYRAIITSPGSGFAIGNFLKYSGTLVGGTSPLNDITLTVNTIGSDGELTSVICSGTVPYASSQYYLKVISTNQFEVYENALMTIPASGIDFGFVGFTTDTVTEVTTGTNALTISNTAVFNVNDAINFTGNTSIVDSTIVANQPYYVYSILSDTTMIISTVAADAGTVVNIANTAAVDFTIAKAGSFALLPEPFYFNQSIIKFNGRLYECLISNNDTQFILSKWELLDSGDRRLNAMDRTIGYYQPTVNMPGVDLTQLFEGVTYPNSIYQGNAFEPSQQYILDTTLQDQPFYPTNVNITSVVYNNGYYFATATFPTYTAVLHSTDNINWTINTLLSASVLVTDIYYANGIYVITSTNNATPIFTSVDGFVWTTAINYGNLPTLELQSAAYQAGTWVVVGNSVLASTDAASNWNQYHSYNSIFNIEMYDVTAVNSSMFVGFVAVGSGLRYDYSTGLTELVPTNILSYSSPNGVTWYDTPSFTPNGLYGVAVNNTTGQIIAVGENGVIYTSTNGANWVGLNEATCVSLNSITNVLSVTNTVGFSVNQAVIFNNSFSTIIAGTVYYIKSIVSLTQITLSATPSGSTKSLTEASIPAQTMMDAYVVSPQSLNNIIYADNQWIAIGDAGTIITSTNGINWTNQTSNTTETLQGITYALGAYTVTGTNNTILTSIDGIEWTDTSVFVPVPPVYDVQGNAFEYGYGPEELVPGVVTDNLTLTVVTRPGTNWLVEEYGHTGFNVISTEIQPTSATQTVYSFDNIVHCPAQLFVQKIALGLGTTLTNGVDYTVNWIAKTITLTVPLPFTPVMDTLRIDVYEVGNGDQLIKSNTNTDPIRTNAVTGFNEIYVDCNYSNSIYNGSGIIMPGTFNVEVQATATNSDFNTIVCTSVNQFTLNSPITFEGDVFGGVAENVTYYIKSISSATLTITISSSINVVTGQAGPIFALSDAIGSMYINVQYGTGSVWTPPIMYHNGVALVPGCTNIATKTTSGTNTITTNSTNGMIVGSPIVFSATIFGPDILPFTTYYVSSIVSSNTFTISSTLNGPVKTLSNQNGGSIFITYDYSFGTQPDGTSAKIIFAKNTYTNDTDYLVYSLFGETQPEQYGYAVPQTQTFIGNGSSAQFALSNFVGNDNVDNAIVEVSGLRVTQSQYDIDPSNNTITFTPPPANLAPINVTTFNDTSRQYLFTQFGITSSPGASYTSLTVGQTYNVVVSYDEITTAGAFIIGQAYVIAVVGTTDFTLIGAASNTVGVAFTATGVGAGTGTAYIAYDESPFESNTNILILSSGTTASLTVNQAIYFEATTIGGLIAGQTYYVTEILNSTEFTVSDQVGGVPTQLTNATGSMTAIAYGLSVAPIVNISNTITPPLATTLATATTVTSNYITVGSTTNFVVGQTVIFQGTGFGGILTDGTVYFVDTIVNSTTFTIMDQTNTQITLFTGTGNIIVIVGGQPAVRVTTSSNTYFAENTLIRIDGVLGSVQLNNNTYYARVISNTVFDLYTQSFNSAVGAVNYPVVAVSAYISSSGGYTWRAGTFYLADTTTSSTASLSNVITVESTAGLNYNTPVIFTNPVSTTGTNILGGLIQGTVYYVSNLYSGTTFSVSAVPYGETFTLTNATGVVNVTQWEQTNVDRIWVTVNGYRIPSSSLRLNPSNEVSILATIVPGNEVIMTNMIPTATPNEEIYMNFVNETGQASIYRANAETRTWLTQDLYLESDLMYLQDISTVTDVITQTSIAPAAINGLYNIGLTNVDKNIINVVTVFDNTTGQLINKGNYDIIIVDLSPILQISAGSYITAGDSLTITTLEGNTVYINGEQIQFSIVNFADNTLGGLSRGANGTGAQLYIPEYAEVFGLLSTNKLPSAYYDQVWNSYVWNATLGDPLTISQTVPADFLQIDIG